LRGARDRRCPLAEDRENAQRISSFFSGTFGCDDQVTASYDRRTFEWVLREADRRRLAPSLAMLVEIG
jgi:hypothetical protein